VALVAVPLSTAGGQEAGVDEVARLRAALADLPDGLTVEVTGAPAFTADLTKVFDGADITLLAVTAGVVALLLLITHRSPFLWILPLLVVAATEQLTLRAVDTIVPALGIHLQEGQVTGIASVLVFGAARSRATSSTTASWPPAVESGTATSATVPSGENWAGATRPPAASRPRVADAPSSAARSGSVSGARSARLTTTTAGCTSLDGSWSWSRSTCVDCHRTDSPVAETGSGLSGRGRPKTTAPTTSAAATVSQAASRPRATRVNSDIGAALT
jgi:hypothetical protein